MTRTKRIATSVFIAFGLVLGLKTLQKSKVDQSTIGQNVPISADKRAGGGVQPTSLSNSVDSVALRFSADLAYGYIERQVQFGPRVPGTKAHRETGDFIVTTLKSFGAQVIEQPFEAPLYIHMKPGEAADKLKTYPNRNLIASFYPAKTQRVMLAAHWDTRALADKDLGDSGRPGDGANDGASGVGVLLEIARVLSTATDFPVGVDMIFFDNEDNGVTANPGLADPSRTWCVGSQYWAENPHVARYRAQYGILLDMVGAKGSSFPREGNSKLYAAAELDRIWVTAKRLGHGHYFSDEEAPSIVDDHVYTNRAGIPTVDIIDMKPGSAALFDSYHHTRDDSMKLIDRDVLRAVGQTVLEAVATTPPHSQR